MFCPRVSVFNSQYLQQALLTDVNCWSLKTQKWMKPSSWGAKASTSAASTHTSEHTSCSHQTLPWKMKVLPSLQERRQNKNKSQYCREFWKIKITVWGKVVYRMNGVNRIMSVFKTKLEQGCLFQWPGKKAWKQSGSQFLFWPRIIY